MVLLRDRAGSIFEEIIVEIFERYTSSVEIRMVILVI